jgi:hypothetical protein
MMGPRARAADSDRSHGVTVTVSDHSGQGRQGLWPVRRQVTAPWPQATAMNIMMIFPEDRA